MRSTMSPIVGDSTRAASAAVGAMFAIVGASGLLGALLAALGPAFQHHIDGDVEEENAARDAEAREADPERRK